MDRPRFSDAWEAAGRIYSPAQSAERVAVLIGGEVARRIRDPIPEHRWVNTCAIRMSYILAQAGMPIPHLSGKTIPGRGHHQYFYRVKALRSFLQQRWGHADVQLNQPRNGLWLSGKQGVIIFGVSGWGDASGHASLFNGSSCYDKCYFNSPGAKYQTRDAVLWVLP